MHRVFGTVLVVAACSTPALVIASQGPGGGGARIHACSLLTRDLVMKVGTVEGKRTIDLLKPTEDDLGAIGSPCEYGGIGLQIDPFARAEQMRKSPEKDWTPVTGVGDTAYFHNNANRWAELFVWTGAHHFTIQMGVPTGSTADAIKPNTIALASEIIPKLK
jgi:hypothetical protein